MSGLEFAIEGPSGEHFGDWDYERQCEDEISFGASDPAFIESKNLSQRGLSERITYNANEKFTFSLIDNVIQVKSFSQSYREVREEFWKTRRTGVFLATGLTVAFSIGAGVMATAPWMTVAAGVFGCAAIVFGIVRAVQAHRQMAAWQKDLPLAVANQRKEAFTAGLLSIFKQDENGAKLHPTLFTKVLGLSEINGLYLEYFKTFQQELSSAHSSSKKLQLLAQAAQYGPLTEKMMNYVKLSPHYATPLTLYYQEHTKFVNAFDSVEHAVAEKIEEVRHSASENIKSVENSKAAALSIIYTTYNLYAKNAENTRDERLAALPPGPAYEHYRVEVLTEYQNSIDQACSIRDTSARLISLPFNARIATIKQERDDYIKGIERNRDAQLLPLFTFIESLHSEAYQVVTGAQAPRQYFDPYPLYPQFAPMPYYAPQPSAPSLEELLRGNQQGYDARVYDAFLDTYRRQAL